jgi:hypothetical protein
MHLAAEAVKLMLQSREIDLKPALQTKDLEKVAAGRRLKLAAMRAEERGVVVADGTGPTGNGNRGIDNFQHDCTLQKKNDASAIWLKSSQGLSS